MYYTYVLSCKNTSDDHSEFYVGYTSDLKKRVESHKSGSTQTTRKYDKVTLVYYEACIDERDARMRENQLKTGFGRGYVKKRVANYIAGLV